ncbi:GcvT family protein [Nesterenkonia muleiensis]|uniref:GcvT family protein n=1 Tax=Nesterenkonia muleiensis TaxID=2282648 RepID=UPI000E74C3CC|nr:FAD-dependent oxidoreductase [Nesterenkonia muleiensis]
MSGPRTVIIGLGVVGAALADELVLRGWNNVTVIDQGPLYATGGSSSHAPGFVFQTGPSRAMSQLAKRTVDKLDGHTVNGQWVSKRVGGVEIATTEERLHDLTRRHGFAESWGIPSRLIGPEEVAGLWPGLDAQHLLGGFHTPTDAVVKGVRAVEFQARRAQAGGATLLPNTKVVSLRIEDSTVTGVRTLPVGAPAGAEPQDVDAEVVVSAAGLWGPGLSRELLGFEIPQLAVEHGFGFSTRLPQLEHIDDAQEVLRPMIRHQDHAMYFREWGHRIALGAYEHRPIPVADHQIASAEEFAATGVEPAVHPFTEQDYLPSWEEAQRLVPWLRGAELERSLSFNGIFSFTPDGGPLLGPVPEVHGLWMAQAVWVTQSAGVGDVMADWITTGDPGIDTSGLDLARFDPAVVSARWAREQGEESYDEVYDIIHPKASTLRLRGLRTSPFYERQEQLGAVFGAANGWERPLWFESNTDRAAPMLGDDPLPARDAWAARHWSPTVAVEARALRAGVGVVDMSSLPRATVCGPDAGELLNTLLSRPVGTKPGTVVYGLLLDEDGGILSDITVATLVEGYHLGINGNQDTAWLRRRAAELGLQVRVEDAASGSCGLGLWGPLARSVLSQLTEAELSNESFRFYRAKQISVAGVPVLALRLSYVGELGWELYAPAEFGRFLWDALFEAGAEHGILPVGRRAFESMRLEKGFRLYGQDITREHTPAEAGLEFAVRGEAADQLARPGAEQPAQKLCCVVLDDPTRVLLGGEPVYPEPVDPAEELEAVGYVTSADQGYSIGASIAYAWLPVELASSGTRVEVAYFGQRCGGSVAQDPLFDSSGERMRS